MATLVLTAVGTAIGGPLGGALGSLIGQAADARLFAPRGRSGPRLSDLRVQTSSYGSVIPRLFGRVRVSGTVIWATDLVEHRNRSGAKGRPTTTTYSYSASFAVALSSRNIVDVRRIWAEGNVLRGSDGLFKSPTKFRIHHGSADQAVDPLIASAEGIGDCPAYRGTAYVVFEDMDLSPFGNRIPSLSFEVVADEGAVPLSMPMADILPGSAIHTPGPVIEGYAVSEETRGQAARRFGDLLPVHPGTDPATRWSIGEDDAVWPVDLGEEVAGRSGRGGRDHYRSAGQRPRTISVGHYDPSRDYQLSIQSARVAGGLGAGSKIDLPIVADAGFAKTAAATMAVRAAHGASHYERPSGFAALQVPVGARIAGADGLPRQVSERRIEGMQIILQLDRPAPTTWVAAGNADGGRGLLSPDQPVGETVGFAYDLPRWDAATAAGANGASAGGATLFASGTGSGWRAAAVDMRAVTDGPLQPVGVTGAAAIMGQVVAAQSAPQAVLFDQHGWVDVDLLRPDMQLETVDDRDLLAGANMAVIGGEIMQFGHAQPTGNRRWRLSRLLRGRLATEDRMAELVPGAPFALIQREAALPLPRQIGLTAVGPGATALLSGAGDDQPVVVPVPATQRALLPLSPVHLSARWANDGSLMLGWVRRSASGYAWVDGQDVPLDERVERYAVTVQAGVFSETTLFDSASATFPAAQMAQWQAGSAAVTFSVAQVGDYGLSPSATVTLG